MTQTQYGYKTISKRAVLPLVEIMIVVRDHRPAGGRRYSQPVKARKSAQKAACIANIENHRGAKAVWALEMKKSDADVPTDADRSEADKKGIRD